MLGPQRTVSFEEVLESGLDKLVELCEPSLGLGDGTIEVFYGRGILHFLRGEREQLRELTERAPILFSKHEEFEFLTVSLALRERIRDRIFDSPLIKAARTLAMENTAFGVKWRGELSILLATAYTIFDSYERACDFYLAAAEAFAKQGCPRKALRSRMNVIVCETNLHPDRNYFARYHDLYRQSLRKGQRDLIVATTCLLNISREYQRAGAFSVALKYCNRALDLFELQMGELNYFLTLVHRAHLLLELGRRVEAQIDIDSARLGHFKEVEAALSVIAPLVAGNRTAGTTNGSATNTEETSLNSTWRERVSQLRGQTPTALKLSELEERLVAYLSLQARDRIDILEELYGSRLDYETKLNRFKSLLSGLRRKLPDVILCEAGQYRLATEIVISTHDSARESQRVSARELKRSSVS